MKKHFYLLLTSLWLTMSVNAQNVGIGTTTPTAAFNVAKGKTVLFGRDTIGDGGRFMYIPSKYACRIGAIGHVQEWGGTYYGDTTAWNYDSIGMFSFAVGMQNKAIQVGSIALGALNNSRGYYSTTLGFNNFAKGTGNLCAGTLNQTRGENSIALGLQNIAAGNQSLALGELNTATFSNSIAIGYENHSSGSNSIAMGFYNNCYKHSSVSIGFWNYNYALGGHIYGTNLVNNSYVSLVLGVNNAPIANADSMNWVPTDPLLMIGNGQYDHLRNNALMMLKNGRTGFGTDSPSGLVHIKYNSSTGIPQLYLQENGNDYARITFKNNNPGFWDLAGFAQGLFGDNANAEFNFYYSLFGGNIFKLKGNGNAVLAGTLSQSSDERLKKNIEPLSDALTRVLKINGYTYNWKDTLRGSDRQIGFIAQELEQQFPELVETDVEGMKSVAYSNMIPVLLEAIKEQQKQIDDLRAILKDK